ncbi:hypothetical protein [Brevibacillus centrosporus]|uniref:hypothetical protein n=1 Tax=Brevibacillus centrosporus TaxID=54910 RepID=UPI002E1BB2C8|nr:hypothetical protein [Brevibacillus centrosporus]
MAAEHRYACELRTKDRLITLDLYAKEELTADEVRAQAITEVTKTWQYYSKDGLPEDLEFVSYKYLGDYSGFE